MVSLLKSDLSIDPFTGLPNLFGLLESTATRIFLETGALIAFDIVCLNVINLTYGRKTGDSCVRALAGLLRSEVSKPESIATAYRTGGDEFILILPHKANEEAHQIANGIQIRFLEMMEGFGISGTNLRIAVIPCAEKDVSAATVLKTAYLALADSRDSAAVSPTLPGWIEGLMDNLLERIRETLELLREAQTLALNDEISGLPNSRAVRLFFEDILRKYQVHLRPYAVLLIDGDNLKQYNDLGYQRGNQMIKDLGAVISMAIRQGDWVARWLSGDEFIVLLPEADRQIAWQTAERIRTTVESATKEWPYPVTISVGIASCPEDGITPDELLAKAEEANMGAKKAGKNQVK